MRYPFEVIFVVEKANCSQLLFVKYSAPKASLHVYRPVNTLKLALLSALCLFSLLLEEDTSYQKKRRCRRQESRQLYGG